MQTVKFSWSLWHHVSSTILLHFFHVCNNSSVWRVEEVPTRSIVTLSAKNWKFDFLVIRWGINYSCEIDFRILFFSSTAKQKFNFPCNFVPSSEQTPTLDKQKFKLKMSSLMLARDSPVTSSGTIQLTNAFWRTDPDQSRPKKTEISPSEVNWIKRNLNEQLGRCLNSQTSPNNVQG